MSKQIHISSIGEIKIENREAIDLTDVEGELQIMNKKGKWVRVRNLGQLANPIQFRVVFEND